MWGPGPWMAPMWAFWWIFPLFGLGICFLFFFIIARALTNLNISPK